MKHKTILEAFRLAVKNTENIECDTEYASFYGDPGGLKKHKREIKRNGRQVKSFGDEVLKRMNK